MLQHWLNPEAILRDKEGTDFNKETFHHDLPHWPHHLKQFLLPPPVFSVSTSTGLVLALRQRPVDVLYSLLHSQVRKPPEVQPVARQRTHDGISRIQRGTDKITDFATDRLRHFMLSNSLIETATMCLHIVVQTDERYYMSKKLVERCCSPTEGLYRNEILPTVSQKFQNISSYHLPDPRSLEEEDLWVQDSEPQVRNLAYEFLTALGSKKVASRNLNQFEPFYNYGQQPDTYYAQNGYQSYLDQHLDYNRYPDYQNYFSGFSLMHDALYLYLNRLVRHIWYLPLITKREEKEPGSSPAWQQNITHHNLDHVQLLLNRLQDFLKVEKDKITKPKENSSQYQRSYSGRPYQREGNGSQSSNLQVTDFVQDLCRYFNNDLANPQVKDEELTDDELLSRKSFYVLVSRCLQVSCLYQVLLNHMGKLPSLLPTYSNQFSELTFSELTLNPGAANLMNKFLVYLMIRSSESDVKDLKMSLTHHCPAFFSAQDASLAETYTK